MAGKEQPHEDRELHLVADLMGGIHHHEVSIIGKEIKMSRRNNVYVILFV